MGALQLYVVILTSGRGVAQWIAQLASNGILIGNNYIGTCPRGHIPRRYLLVGSSILPAPAFFMTKTRIYLQGRGYGMSMGNMIEMLSGEASKNQEGNWIEVEEIKFEL